jgi:hypothetical protein
MKLSIFFLLLFPTCHCARAHDYFAIKVVDDQTSRGVPLVELETVNNIRYMTDSNGLVAFDEPGLMDQTVFFHVRSHGYEFPKDGFGFRGKALHVTKGGSAELKIKRLNIAERLYRVTGQGIYRDSVLVGEKTPLSQPTLNGLVMGQDSVMATPYRGKIYWFWGDTNRVSYPLGQYHTSGATSKLPADGGLDPSAGIDLEYFVDDKGFSKRMCPFGGQEPIWIDGLLTAHDDSGHKRLVSHYKRMKSLGEMLEHGLAIFNDEEEVFQKDVVFDRQQVWQCPREHPVRIKETGTEYFVFPGPYANVRVKAKLASLREPNKYDAFTCLKPGTRYVKKSAEVERDGGGKVVWGWKTNTDPITSEQERELIQAGKLDENEAYYQLVDRATGKRVRMHASSIYWNDFRQKWIMIGEEVGGMSFMGEIWFAEAPELVGPWRDAVKIVTHERYSFYNPTQHPFFDQEGGRYVYFEATYTHTFSGNPEQTPRYDYNQIMYRLDLADPRLGNAGASTR